MKNKLSAITFYIIKGIINLSIIIIGIAILIIFLINQEYNGLNPNNPDSRKYLGVWYEFINLLCNTTFITITISMILFAYRDFRKLFFKSNLSKLFFVASALTFYYIIFFSDFGEWFYD